ncbi:BCCT family transporter (plasmid) [Paracoccus versutus]|uniref:Choline/carnitine/betaine transport n=1 Tax=Paracoccus versutus TaxID=34007 RepID=A0AAQ0HKA7_PARVE|nr:BCCT family transporter [Paracoccus versutus]KGJ08363.1 glycine/betaine ABC transporter permease [Paracoccus versutus]REG54415.1 choline/carnitine/betaine transport [Paracoccus versutus]WEJ80208.1 BCCT family transporter [Paracoccus versutus]
MQPSGSRRINPGVFWPALAVAGGFVTWGVLGPDSLAAVASATLNWIIRVFGWSFVISTAFFLAFAIFLAFSRFGRIKLGHDDEKPEFSTRSWVCMMFSVGMGIGLMFWGVAEPISHFGTPPHGLAEPQTQEAALVAMQYAYFHWALHPWAIYAMAGLAMAYFSYRRDLPTLVSSAFHPLLGDRIHGPMGRMIDILAIIATLFGTATSLGLGAQQINSGMNYLWNTGESPTIALTIIAVLSVLFILSAVSGVGRGIQFLSNINMVAALMLLLFLAVLGPTVFILDTLIEAMGLYMSDLVSMSFRTSAFSDSKWLASWTIFYWAWWVSWAPFVGVFIARISRGRTIREFVVGVLLIPSAVTFVWFTVMGGSALFSELTGPGGLVEAIAGKGEQVSLFALLEQYPLHAFTSSVAMFLVAIFFVSGADAASVVMGMLSSFGTIHPRAGIVVLWGLLAGASASILLVVGGLGGLQTASIIAAAPFLVVMVGLCASLWKGLLDDIEVHGHFEEIDPHTGGLKERHHP